MRGARLPTPRARVAGRGFASDETGARIPVRDAEHRPTEGRPVAEGARGSRCKATRSRVRTRTCGTCTIVAAEGEFDLATADHLGRVAHAATARAPETVVLDLAGMSLLDSTTGHV